MTDDKRKTVRRLEDQEVATRIENLEKNQEKFFDVLLGPKDRWGKRQTEKGMEATVRRIDQTLGNGGVRVKLPPGLWALLVAITTGLVTIGVALIQANGG